MKKELTPQQLKMRESWRKRRLKFQQANGLVPVSPPVRRGRRKKISRPITSVIDNDMVRVKEDMQWAKSLRKQLHKIMYDLDMISDGMWEWRYFPKKTEKRWIKIFGDSLQLMWDLEREIPKVEGAYRRHAERIIRRKVFC